MKRFKIGDLIRAKRAGRRICAVTAVDYASAFWLEETGADLILVGDSLGMVSLGYEDTTPVTLDQMIHHARAVARAKPSALLVADMPYRACRGPLREAVARVRRMMREGGVEAVKIEGGREIAPLVEKLTGLGIPVLGHIGLLPQEVRETGYRVFGRDEAEADRLVADAVALERAGVSGMVVECVREPVARRITESVRVPTLGIGAGRYCDGQILVLYDLVGLYPKPAPRFARRFAALGPALRKAVGRYARAVREGTFPASGEVYGAEKKKRA